MEQEFDFDTYVALMADTLGIAITQEERPGVVLQMRRTAVLAAEVMVFEVPQDLELAPVFKA